MEKDKNILKQINRKTGFKVPEDYFENLNDRIMSHLPAIEVKEKTPVSLWQKCKPWIYMAAMFAGIWLMMKMFTGIFSVEKGETPDMEMTASATDGSTIEDEWIAYYVDDYTAYEMLYTDSDY